MSEKWKGAKPIETIYKGYRFRSRLEARWAVFFDALDLEWEYEAEGFDLGGVWYLPDFWFPSLDCWIEIKPESPDSEETEKARRLAVASGKWVFLFPFSPRPFGGKLMMDGGEPIDVVISGSALYFRPDGDYDGCYNWGECPRCHRVDVGLFGESIDDARCGCDCQRDYATETPRLLAAYAAARSARFEGERR